MKCPINKLLVTIEKKYQDKSGALFLDTTFQPEEYATLKGIVYSIPDRVDKESFRNVEQLARVGDEIWFSYAIVFDYLIRREGETPVYRNLIAYEGSEYWQVDYSEVFCIVRDREILMPNQFVLLAPVKDNGSDQQASGLFSVKKNEVYEDIAEVVAVPKSVNCVKGDIIPFEPEYLQKYIMFDSPHFILPARKVVAKF